MKRIESKKREKRKRQDSKPKQKQPKLKKRHRSLLQNHLITPAAVQAVIASQKNLQVTDIRE
ncbi:MAG: hypothetical protein K5644_05680 [Lachnospiraceae bacterium]|nr:hypothetical protein [Lachnospiraceae bacterium]